MINKPISTWKHFRELNLSNAHLLWHAYMLGAITSMVELERMDDLAFSVTCQRRLSQRGAAV